MTNLDRHMGKRENADDILFDTQILKDLTQRFETRFGDTRPDPRVFAQRGVYTPEDVMADLIKTKDLHAEHGSGASMDHEGKKRAADVFEAIVIEESMKSAWLGRGAKVVPTAHYDDYVNKVDALAEIHSQQDGKQHLGLAMDVTFSKNENDIVRKLEGIRKNIEKGKAPAYIKYAMQEGEPSKGIFVPKVVIGADADTVRELVKLMHDKSSTDERTWKQAEHDLNFHIFQTKMLIELQEQLRAFTNLAYQHGNERTGRAYFKAGKIVESIIAEKSLFQEQSKSDSVKNDYVVQTISEYLQGMK